MRLAQVTERPAQQVRPERRRVPGRRRRQGVMSHRSALALALPAVLVVSGSMLYALYQVIRLSLLHQDFLSGGPATFVGLANYASVLTSSAFQHALARSVEFTVLSVVGQLVLAVVLAVLTWSDSRGMKVCRAAVGIPWAIPPIVVAIIWRFLYLPGSSPVAAVISALGLKQGVLAAPGWSMIALVAVSIWEFTPLYFLFVSAGLRGINQSVLEAARLDGAGRLRLLMSIVIPQLRRLLATLAVFDTLSSMGLFDLIWVMTGSSSATSTSTVYVYQNAFQSYNFGASAAAVLVTAVAGIVLAAIAYALLTWERR
jgi:multiple sugar transport system permease protein